MVVSKREKVIAVLEAYAEGGTISAARKAHGMRSGDFYLLMADDPELQAKYRFVRKCRGDMCADEAYEKLTDMTDEKLDSSRLRPTVDGLLKLASLHNREDYGDKVDLTITARPTLLPEIEARIELALRPQRDLGTIIDVESEAIPSLSDLRAPDSTSDAPAVGTPNPFED